LKIKKNSFIEVSASELSESGQIIRKKLSGKKLSEQEITTLISEIVHNDLTEVELAYFVAAEKLRGMSIKEVVKLVSGFYNVKDLSGEFNKFKISFFSTLF